MKKIVLTFVFIYTGMYCYPQTHEELISIAFELKNNKTYQSACEYSYSLPFGDTLMCELFITTQKVPADNFCGFYYNFQTADAYRNVNSSDFTIYFDSVLYYLYLGKIKKTSYYESPSQFIEIKLENGFIPSIQKRTKYYEIVPYELGKKIESIIRDPNMIISRKPDTIIELDTCLRYILESKSENNPFDRTNPDHWKEGKTIYEMCFHYASFYPVLYKNEVYTPITNQIQTAHFRNTKINAKLPANYFSEENLLPLNWDKPEEIKQDEKKSPDDLVGKKAPEWILPILGSEENYSSDNLKGKTVLVEFTATWCGACFRATEMINRLEMEFENNHNIEIVSIYSSNIDTKGSIKKFVSKLNQKGTVL